MAWGGGGGGGNFQDTVVLCADSRSDSGMELLRLGDELEVIVLRVGLPANGRPYSAGGGCKVYGMSIKT